VIEKEEAVAGRQTQDLTSAVDVCSLARVIVIHPFRSPISMAFTSKVETQEHIFCDSISPTNSLSVQQRVPRLVVAKSLERRSFGTRAVAEGKGADLACSSVSALALVHGCSSCVELSEGFSAMTAPSALLLAPASSC
jgi:hypothetical protein